MKCIEYANSSNFDHISHLSHKRPPYEGNYINIDKNRNRHTINPIIKDSSRFKTVWFLEDQQCGVQAQKMIC